MLLNEIHIIGRHTYERRIGVPECDALASHGLRLCGLSDAAAPYRMVRPRLEWSECLITLSGHGEVLVSGKWHTVGAGDAYLAGIGAAQAFHACPGERWEFVWVQSYRQLYSESAVLNRAEGSDLGGVILALHREVLGPGNHTIFTHLAALVNAYASRLSGPASDERLRALWQAVDAHLSYAWSLESLASKAGVSSEHLRRLALAEQGLTPMRYVRELRLRRAAALLCSSPMKLEAIASEVGFGSVYSFATVFKRWSGKAPGEWREWAAHSDSRTGRGYTACHLSNRA